MSLTFRRNYHILIIFFFVLAFLVTVLGSERVIAYVFEPAQVDSVPSNIPQDVDYTNSTTLFDDSIVHSVSIIMDSDEYDEMIATYQVTGEKEYFHADIVIDGVPVNDVGIRLKGNSSLRGALGGGDMPGGQNRQFPGGQQPPDGMPQGQPGQDFQLPENMPQVGEDFQPPEDFQIPNFQDGQGPQNMPGPSTASSAETKIPFQIKFDEFVDGQTYQGYERIALRTYGISYDASMLQEPVTNEIVRLAGIPATLTAYTGMQINDEEPTLYVISEILDENYLEAWFDYGGGVLYKAEIGATLTYKGEDPSAYSEAFSQETRENEADMKPLIEFLRFINESDDATFAAELGDHFDVDTFAMYLAVNDLLVNTDSMIGMNNNYYLYYDDQAEKFTILLWDTNESLGKLSGGNNAELDLYFENANTMMGGNRNGDQNGFAGPGGGNGGFMPAGNPGGGTNALMERFMEVPAFKALYDEKVKEVYEIAFVKSGLDEAVARYSDLIRSVNDEMKLVDIEAYDVAVASVKTFIQNRMEYLKTTALLGN